MRTTSSVEGMNSCVQDDLPKHTDIFRFIASLKLFESEKSSELHFLSLEKNLKRQLQRKRPEDRIRDAQIKANTELLQNGEISVGEFLKAMSKKELLPKTGTKLIYCAIANDHILIFSLFIISQVSRKSVKTPIEITNYLHISAELRLKKNT